MEKKTGQPRLIATSGLLFVYTLLAIVILFLNAAKVIDFLQLALDQEQVSALSFLFSPFVHENVLHILLMMLFLAVPAADLEPRLGSLALLGIALGGAYCGALAWLLIPSGYALIGAAGSVNACWTAYLVLHVRQPSAWLLFAFWAVALFLGMPVDDYTYAATPASLILGSSLWGALIAFDAIWRRKVPFASDILSSWPKVKWLIAYLFPAERKTNPAPAAVVSARENATRLSASLMQRLSASPDDIALNQQVLEALMIAKASGGEIARQGRTTLHLLLRENQFADAFDLWWRLNQRLGFFEAPPDELIRLIKDRLAQNEWSQASELVISMQKVDPHHNLLPEQMQNLIRLIAVQRGPQSEQAQRWLRVFETQYPKHPMTETLRRELNNQGPSEKGGGIELSADGAAGMALNSTTIQQNAAPRPGSSSHIQNLQNISLDDELQTVQDLLYAGNIFQAAEILTKNQTLISQFDPLILYDAAQRLLANPQSRAKGVFLIELTVRGHLNHPNTPQLVTGLITAYCRDLAQPALARQWLGYMRERWPEDPALREAQTIVDEG